MTPETERLVYRVAELAEFLGWSEETIRREIKAGHLRARKLRADTVIRHADLLDWLDNLPIDPDFATAEQPAMQPAPIARAAQRPAVRPGRVSRLLDILPSARLETVE